MPTIKGLFLLVFLNFTCILPTPAQTGSPAATTVRLPARYFEILDKGVRRIEELMDAQPDPTLALLEKDHPFAHFPHSILVAAVLYTKSNPSNKHYGDPKMLSLAIRIGDMLAAECEKGSYQTRQDNDWDTYMWLDAFRIIKSKLDKPRRLRWGKAILKNLSVLEPLLVKYRDFPYYNAPFIVTSPNHFSIYASTLLAGGVIFNRPQWVRLASKVLHRFCVQEQTPDGYWGEHSQAGPTTGYDYVTVTQISLYWEYSKDPDALKALRRSTDFHKFFTYSDGTPVETINDRNRYWGVSMWGHFGFSHFPDGRRYAAFLTGFFPMGGDRQSYGGDLQSLGRLAQDALYYHEGESAPIPQDEKNYVHAMKIPAGIRKTGDWTVTYSGIIAPPVSLNNFFLDRQSNFSIFNKTAGLIISGANSKRQPELASFTEAIGKDSIHMPVSTRLQMSDTVDQLALAYNVFFAMLEVPRPQPKKLPFRILIHYKWGEAVAQFHLQLMLRAGMELETGAGKKITLGADSIDWGDEQLGGSIRHKGWILRLPPNARLTWPIYPFNPYKDAPETELSKAIGLISIPLQLKDQELPFELEVD